MKIPCKRNLGILAFIGIFGSLSAQAFFIFILAIPVGIIAMINDEAKDKQFYARRSYFVECLRQNAPSLKEFLSQPREDFLKEARAVHDLPDNLRQSAAQEYLEKIRKQEAEFSNLDRIQTLRGCFTFFKNEENLRDDLKPLRKEFRTANRKIQQEFKSANPGYFSIHNYSNLIAAYERYQDYYTAAEILQNQAPQLDKVQESGHQVVTQIRELLAGNAAFAEYILGGKPAARSRIDKIRSDLTEITRLRAESWKIFAAIEQGISKPEYKRMSAERKQTLRTLGELYDRREEDSDRELDALHLGGKERKHLKDIRTLVAQLILREYSEDPVRNLYLQMLSWKEVKELARQMSLTDAAAMLLYLTGNLE